MIKNIPTPKDFEDSGIAFFNMAWDFVLNLISILDDSELESWDSDGEIKNQYWHSSQRQLSTALSLTQQGIEFLLKGKISSFSPYLLITANPREWPSKCNIINTNYSAFRTIDAQDLIKVHDTVADKKLPKDFKDQFDKLRKLRNTYIHTVDKKLKITVKEVLESTLKVQQILIGEQKWFSIRLNYLSESPESIAYSDDYLYDQLLREAASVIEILDNKHTKCYFNFNKRQRKYVCYNCAVQCEDYDVNLKFAQLKPNDRKSKEIYCFVCNGTYDVERLNCENTDCKGNVIDAVDGVCLTCYE